MIAKLGRLLPFRRRSKQVAKALRIAGDAARERRHWRKAAEAYASYLNLRPRDFHIWVQLGHMHKEAGAFDFADAAYARAMWLRPDNDDLLLSLGHLRKLENKQEEAAGFFTRAARSSGNAEALRELRSGWLPDTLRMKVLADLHTRDRQTEKTIAKSLTDISLVAALDVKRDHESGRLHLTGYAPQLIMQFPTNIASAPVAHLEILFEREEFTAEKGTLFLDDGKGYRQDNAIKLAYAPAKICRLDVFVAAPGALQAIKWDLGDSITGSFKLISIAAKPVRSIDDLVGEINNIKPELEGEYEVQAVPDESGMRAGLSSFFNKTRLNPTDQKTMQPFLPPWTERNHNYAHWLHLYDSPTKADYDTMSGQIEAMAWRPRFSFVMPVYNTPPQLLIEVLDAMLGQNYPDFEICIADDASPDPKLVQIIDQYRARDSRIKYVRRDVNGHISLSSNSAAKTATGDFLVLIDHDDLIPTYALFVVAIYLNRFPDARILFSDEDKINLDGARSDPYFKSCYNEYLMFGHNMVSHLGIYQRELFERVGGFRKGLEGSQDYDLFLRCAEKVDPHQIIHIPHVLYHWRQVPGSTAISADQKDYAILAARSSIGGHFERMRVPLTSVEGHAPGNSAIAVPRELETTISIIIPTRNGVDLLNDCLTSISRYRPYNTEVLIIDNDSDEDEAITYIASLAQQFPDLDIRAISVPGEFNFSSINNQAASQARGEILCFLNNDTEVLTASWLDRARGLLVMDDVGAVGARLLYPDNSIQHFGIVTGMYRHGVAGGVHLFENANGYGYFSKHRMIGEFTAVTAACMFVRRADFNRVGGFDPSLAVAYNDVDLCLKLRALGRRTLCDPGIQLIHKESKSRGSDLSPNKARRLSEEAARMKDKWGDRLSEDPYYSPNLSRKRPDFSLAYPPRQPWPWQVTTAGQPAIASGAIARSPRFSKMPHGDEGGFLAICAILKNEAINILEWIAYHYALGVERFYLYDNNSTDHVHDLLSGLIQKGIVELISWPINPGQTQAYDDFADRHKYRWAWAAFIDLDEFINPFGHDSLPDWLAGFEGASAVALQWMNFGPNGNEIPPAGLMIEGYTTRFPDHHAMHGHVKTIVRMAHYNRAQGPHSFDVHGTVVNEYGQEIDQSVGYAILPPQEHRSICINHYYTRSRLEWQKKLQRGLADHGSESKTVRNPEWIEIYEREAIVPDMRILKFAERTRQTLHELDLPLGPQYRGS